MTEINIDQDLFANEAKLAEENRSFFKKHGLMTINLLASPGAGKTSFIKQTAQYLKVPLAVIEGDPASSIDTDHLNSLGIPAYQINTQGGCHLEAPMIMEALQIFKLSPQTLLFIENVGNLICTASYPLGEALRVVVLGITEGDDKPLKYPDIFQSADVVILNKIDLKPMVDFNQERFLSGLKAQNQKASVFEVSCKTGAGLGNWINWLAVKMAAFWGEQG
ncbi:MAG TPA: hydrogenase nickel incorporation protein HypB [Bacillota bacterium]|nr:hydrogenase nickel incorporation protein HypB [Bacillota bacterium]